MLCNGKNAFHFRKPSRLNTWVSRLSWLSWMTIAISVVVVAGIWFSAGYYSHHYPFPNQTAALEARSIQGVASVTDGDTIEIHGTRIRLHGIDAPESDQTCLRPSGSTWRCGQAAALALQEHVGRQVVSCSQRDVDRYGRVVARCSLGEIDINSWLVANGWAVAYRQYSFDYVDEEKAAKAGRVGIWAGAFVMPWEWRRGKRLTVTSNTVGDCRIKGNISTRSGERIYHVPGGRYYSRTHINTAKGERWFCSEEEAQQAGWRRSRR